MSHGIICNLSKPMRDLQPAFKSHFFLQSRGRQIAQKTFVDTIRVKTFIEIDQRRPEEELHFSFLAEPGNYKIQMSITDQETFRAVTVTKT